jgi:hypothetical protein
LITVSSAVLVGNVLYHSVNLAPLPAGLTANGCPNCPFLLAPSIVSGPANTSIDYKLIPATQYQYVLTNIIPNGASLSGVVVLSLKLNSSYASYFSASDLAQQVTWSVDLATVTKITPLASAAGEEDLIAEDAELKEVLRQLSK